MIVGKAKTKRTRGLQIVGNGKQWATIMRENPMNNYETCRECDAKQAVSVPEWIKCSDRLPAEYDGDFEGLVWVNDRDMTLPKYAQSRVHWSRVRGIAGYTHWMPTNLVRPEPPKQEEGHE
jgi:hypothetical protein